MRVLVDLRCLQSPPPRGGVGVYAEHIIRELLARDQRHEYLFFVNGLVDPRQHLPQFDFPNVRWIITRWPNKVFNSLALLPHCPAALLPSTDVVFLPNLNFIPRLPARTKLVVTVHDLSFEHFPDCFTVKQRLWHHFVRPQKLLQRANAIIAVSETTKRDVVETYGIPEEKVRVVYPGVEHPNATNTDPNDPNTRTFEAFGSGIRSIRMFPGPFILSISELSPRKNLDGLIAAFEHLTPLRLYTSTPPIHLVLAGVSGSAERPLRRQIARSPARDRIHLLGSVSENEKRALLARASCFVYPSLWEGFGFPALEAMAEGCPVVASTGGSLPEILGDAALLVDPLNPAAIADALRYVLTDDALRRDLIVRGRERASRYQWRTAAATLHRILTSV